MVARLVRLRLALLASAFRGGPRRFIRACLIGIVALAFAGALAQLPVWMARTIDERNAIDTVITALLLATVALVSIFARVGNLEPRQFASFPASSGQVATAMLLTSVLSWPALWLLAWMGALVALRPDWLQTPAALATAGVLTLVLAIAFSRVASAFVLLVVPQRATALLRWAGLLLLIAALPIIVFMMTEAFRSPGSSMTIDAGRVLGWTPFGAPAAGLGLMQSGDESAALARFAVAAGTFVVLVVLWYLVVARSLSSIESPMPEGAATSGLEFFERFPAKPRTVIAARALTYWRRDPRYRVALFAIPLAPIVMLIALWIAGVDPQLLALLPLPVILLLLGWSVHNDVALDSTAVWMHVASGTRGVHDRAGRATPVLLFGLPLVVIGSSISVTATGDWRVLPAVIGMNLGVLLVATGVSSVFSVLMPYPATRPGDSPFAQPAVQGSGAGLAQTLAMLVALIFSIPPVMFAVQAIIEPTFYLNVLALGVGAAWGGCVFVLGLLMGGRIFDRRAPELVAVTQTFD